MRNDLEDALRLDPARKRALLAKLLRAAPSAGPAPLSFAQGRLWLLDQIESGNSKYNVSFTIRLGGALDDAALEGALGEIVRRHDMLRAVFGVADGEPVQRIAETFGLKVHLVELATLEPTASLESLLAEHAERVFDLQASPAIRAVLIRTAPNEHVLSVIMHHIVTDGWSMSVFRRELGILYDAYRSGRPSPLRHPASSYGDFVRAQREQLSGDLLERRLHFWKDALRDAPGAFDLLPHRTHAARTSRGRVELRTIAAATRDAVVALGRGSGATLFCTLFAAFVALLHRYSGARDIVVGTALANRTRSEFEDVIGFFVNTVPLRTRIAADPTFTTLLAQVTAASLEAFDNGDVPFEKLIEALQPARSGARTPLVNVMFVLQNTPDEALQLAGLEVAPVALASSTAKFDLTLQVTDSPGGLAASLEYSTDLYESATMAALLDAFETLLRGVASDPARTLSELPLLSTTAERRQLVTWNDTARPLDDCRIEASFERQVARTPHAIAVESASERLSYESLNARANRLARYLQSAGVRTGDRIGVCLERGHHLVVGILAILKAGGAYVPLDPSYPSERLRFMLRDTAATVVLTQRRFLESLNAAVVQTVCLDATESKLESFSAANVAVRGKGADLAYVMYTSGSTGTPKGVMIPHRAIARLVVDPNYVAITSAHAVGLSSNVSFDASTFELWTPLLSGGRLVIIPKDVLLSPSALAAYVTAHRVDAMFVTTSLFVEIVRRAPATFRALTYLLVGGEALHVEAIAHLGDNERPAHVINVYGPTETTTFATHHEILGVQSAEYTVVPLGRPISNTEVLILDERRKLLPPGAEGQLYVGGMGLALGYLHDAELTARKFVDHPLRGGSGEKLYATGDLARYLPSGDIEFLGRTDAQLKVRGFRVEPGEIEAALRSYPGVTGAVALARDDASAGKQLAGYVTVARPCTFDVASLMSALRRRLPPHLVPDVIVELEAFPLTASGKLDRTALSASMLPPNAIGEARAGSELEVQLIAIWEHLLGVAPVGIRDNFFALGGHSLLAVRLIADIESAFAIRLPLAVLFEEPTVEHIADALRRDPASLNRAPLVTLNSGGAAPPFFFLHGSLTGGGYYCLALAKRLGAARPLHLLRPHGVDGRPLPSSVEAMAAEYVGILKTTQPQGPYLLGGFCSGGLVAFEMARQLRARGETVRNVVLIDAPPASRLVRTCAEAIDRYGALLRFHPSVRAGIVRSIARAPHHLRRLARSSSKSAFVRERLPSLAAALARIVRRDDPQGGAFENSGPRNLLKEWKQISEAYVARRYDGRITVLVAHDTGRAHRTPSSGWSAIAPRVDVRSLKGDHFTCITEHVADTASALDSALGPD